MHLGVVAECADVVCQVECDGAFDFVGAKVGEFCFETGKCLGLIVVLLKSDANDVLVLYPAFFACI